MVDRVRRLCAVLLIAVVLGAFVSNRGSSSKTAARRISVRPAVRRDDRHATAGGALCSRPCRSCAHAARDRGAARRNGNGPRAARRLRDRELRRRQLPRRQDLRLVLEPGAPRLVPARRRDPGLAAGHPRHEGRRAATARHTARPRLRRSRTSRHRTERDAVVRRRPAEHRLPMRRRRRRPGVNCPGADPAARVELHAPRRRRRGGRRAASAGRRTRTCSPPPRCR